MLGQLRTVASRWICVACAGVVLTPAALAAPVESSDPIGGITFEPPRRANIRLKSGQRIRGELIAVSAERVHLRLMNGREFHYELDDVRSILTNDREFRFTSAHDTFRELVEQASQLQGVHIDASSVAAATGQAIEMPRPPAPSVPVVVDSPDNYERVSYSNAAVAQVDQPVPVPVPVIPPAQQATVAGPSGEPFHETNAFKVGFLLACLAVVALWWRNKVG